MLALIRHGWLVAGRGKRLHLAWLLLTALSMASAICNPEVAHAQRSRSSLEQARTRMEQGQAYFLQGRFGESAAEFEAAFQIQPFAAFLYNAGLAYENAGELGRAAEFYVRFASAETNEAQRTEVQTRIEGLRARIEARRLELESQRQQREQQIAAGETPPPIESEDPEAISAPPSAAAVQELLSLVAVETEPAGATVTVTFGGNVVATGPSPLTQTLDPGSYRILIEHPDYNRFEHDFEVQPGVLNRFFLNLSQGEFLGYLRVTSTPPGAHVYIDDREQGSRGQTPFETPIQAGPHHMWIERAGYAQQERDFEIVVAEQVDLAVPLERVNYGRIRVVGNVRGALVYVDDEQVGAVPWEGQVAAGERHIRVRANDMKDWTGIVDVARGQLRPIRVRLRPAMGRSAAVLSGVFGALFLGGAIAANVISNDLYSQLEREREAGTLQLHDDRITQGFALSIGTYAGYGVAGLLGALSLFYAIYDDKPDSEANVLVPRDWAVLPTFSPTGDSFGLSVMGSF